MIKIYEIETKRIGNEREREKKRQTWAMRVALNLTKMNLMGRFIELFVLTDVKILRMCLIVQPIIIIYVYFISHLTPSSTLYLPPLFSPLSSLSLLLFLPFPYRLEKTEQTWSASMTIYGDRTNLFVRLLAIRHDAPGTPVVGTRIVGMATYLKVKENKEERRRGER